MTRQIRRVRFSGRNFADIDWRVPSDAIRSYENR